MREFCRDCGSDAIVTFGPPEPVQQLDPPVRTTARWRRPYREQCVRHPHHVREGYEVER